MQLRAGFFACGHNNLNVCRFNNERYGYHISKNTAIFISICFLIATLLLKGFTYAYLSCFGAVLALWECTK